MSEWREVTLGEVATKVGSGATPRGGKDAYSEDGVALIRSMNVRDDGFEFDGLARIDAQQAGRLNHVTVEAGDVLVNITGASVARCCLAPSVVLPARVNQHVAIIRLRREGAIPRFVSAYLTSPDGKGRLLNLASGGATREALTKAMLEGFKVRLPNLEVQGRVAEILQALDDLIENNRQRVEVLQEVARGIYREWFVHLRYPGHESVPLVDSSLGPIPEGWQVHRCGDLLSAGILDIGDGYRAKNSELVGGEDGLPFVRVANVRDGSLALEGADRLPAEYVERLKAKVSQPGDVVISMKGTVGRQALVQSWHPSLAYSPQVSYWRSLDSGRISPSFLYEWIGSAAFITQCAAAKGGTAMADYVNLTDQRRMFLAVPGARVMGTFADRAVEIHSMVGSLLAARANLASLRDLLLPKLVTGQIDVSSLDLDSLVEGSVG